MVRQTERSRRPQSGVAARWMGGRRIDPSGAGQRPRNLLGLKYVQINRGVASRVFADGALLPVSRTSVPVQFDDVFKTFDGRTRSAIQRSLVGSGDVLAARGSSKWMTPP